MANPFLIEDNEAQSNLGFNPFLSGNDYTDTGLSENPFLSSFTAQEQTDVSANLGASNPFSFGEDPAATTNLWQDTGTTNYENFFASPQTQVPSNASANQNLLFSDDNYISGTEGGTDSFMDPGDKDMQTKAPPPRPLPPRETTELIRSVTGAMEATSSHLLDRLQATRTPSPTPMRELHSPSPTHFGDLLEVDEPFASAPQPQLSQQPQEINLMDDFDLMSEPPSQPVLGQPMSTTVAPAAPVSPSGPTTPPPTPHVMATSQQPPMNLASETTEAFHTLDSTNNSQPPSLLDEVTSPVVSVETSLEHQASPIIPPQPELSPVQSHIEKPPSPAIPDRPLPPQVPPQPAAASHAPPHPPPPSHPTPVSQPITPTSQPPVPPPHSVPPPVAHHPTPPTSLPVTAATVAPPPPSRPAPPQRPKPPAMPARPPPPAVEPRHQPPARPQPVFEEKKNGTFADVFGSQTTQEITSEETFSSSFGTAQVDDSFSQNTHIESSPVVDSFAEVPQSQPSNVFESSTTAQNDFSGTQQADAFPPQNDNIFGAASDGNDIFGAATTAQSEVFAPVTNDVFGSSTMSSQPQPDAFGGAASSNASAFNAFGSVQPPDDAFDAFAAKFESAGARDVAPMAAFDAFGSSAPAGTSDEGFGADESFDAFLALSQPPPVPQGTPARVLSRGQSGDSDNGNEFNVFIRPKDETAAGAVPVALPPPRSPQNVSQDTSPRFNPFDNSAQDQLPSLEAAQNIFNQAVAAHEESMPKPERTDSQETPPTPLFDEDVSQPLEEFPRIDYDGAGWEMHLRQPNKKKITGQRFWKKIWVKLVYQGENPVLQLFNGKDDKDPFQELPLQPCYSVSDIGAQQFDQFGKIFTIKVQFIFYKERPGVRPGQVTKAERITNKLSQFAAYAIQGDYQGVKEFGSDLKKLGLPVEHAPQISQLFKLGSFSFEDMKQFSVSVEEALFKLSAHRDRALNYKMEEVQITAVDELYVEQNATGAVLKQIARVRLFFLGFLSGMPDVELGVNDMVRQGKEVVGRHDIIPVVTEEWIRLEHVEFHSCIQLDEYDRTKTIRFKPPDACYLELMRFRVRPPRNRELPLQLKAVMCVTGNKVDLRGDILVPGFTSRKLGQIPCEDIMVRFPIPECWIYLFRVEKHFRYGSVKSAHRRTGKVKGIERFLGAVDNLEPSLMEVTSGQAKYEHQHRAIVWRIPRLPKEGQGAYTVHNFVCRMALTSYDQIPEELAKYAYVEFTMPATVVSHMTVRSVSICNSDSDDPPEKYVRQLSRHEYRVEIEHTQGQSTADYLAVTKTSTPEPPAPVAPTPAPPPPESDSDSDSA